MSQLRSRGIAGCTQGRVFRSLSVAAGLGFSLFISPLGLGASRAATVSPLPSIGDMTQAWAPTDPAPEGSLPLLQAQPGVTALAGRVLATDGTPLRGVKISEGLIKTETDAYGRFLLRDLHAGWDVLVIDGHQAVPIEAAAAARPDTEIDYGYYEVRIAATAAKTTQLPWTSWLPRIDHEHDVAISTPTTEAVTVHAATVPGLELRIPAGSIITGPDGKIVHAVGITPIPIRRTPFPLPRNVPVPVYFTAQPGGSVISSADGSWLGAQVVYPNYNHELPRARGTFWRYEPDSLGWTAYGTGTVTSDGSQVVPDEGTRIYALTGAMFNGAGSTPPPAAPPPSPPDGKPGDGDPVDLASGLFVQSQTDLALSDVIPLALTRTYRPGDYNRRSFGVGMSMGFDTFLWSANQYQQVDLVSADGSRVHYTRIINPSNPTDNGYTTAHFISTTPGPYYQSHVDWNGNGWNLTRQDGTLLVYGENAPLQFIQDRFGNRITLTRTNGESGSITQVSSPNGRYIQFSYDSSNRVIQATDNIGRTLSYLYDSTGRLSTVTDPNGGVTTYTWDSSNRVQSIQDARGNTIFSNTFDSNDRVLTQTLPDGSHYQFAYTLDGNGNVTETDVTDPLGNSRKVTFNAQHYKLTDKRAVGTTQEIDTSYTRDPTTNYATAMVDGLGRTTSWVYDQNGNLTSETKLAGSSNAVTTSYTYSTPYNQVLTATDPLQHTTLIQRNALGEAVSITDPLSRTTTLTYNAQGQIATITDPLNQQTTLSYDHGDLVAITDPLLRTTSFYTDAIGRRVRASDPLGNQVQWLHDAIDGVHQTIDPLGAITTVNYNADGYVASIVDARSATTAYSYDAQGRLTVRTDPLQHTDQITQYDGNGNMLAATDRKGQAVSKSYDPLNRISSASYADGSTVAYTWDKGSRLTQVQDSIGGTITRVYDGLNRLTSETTGQGTVSYTYDAAGRRATMTVPGQSQVSYTFDVANRLTTITQGSAVTSLGYDNANRRTSLTLPNGIVATYAFDAASQLTGITYNAASTTVGTLTYSYDLVGHITSRGGTLFQSVLPQAVSSASYDAANRLTARTASGVTASPSWDLNGSLTSDGLRSYSWDSRNRLTAIQGVASYVYDGMGRRQTSTVGSTAKSYLYDGSDVLQEQQGGSPSANLLTGAGVDERFTRTTTGTGGSTSTYLTDALGSAVALVNASGVVQTNYGYDAYGVTSTTGTTNGSPFQFAGRENDNTGLYYNRARYYNPSWGRFISEDPIGFSGGINKYAYVGGNPVSARDPSGLKMNSGSYPAEADPSPTPPISPSPAPAAQPDQTNTAELPLPNVFNGPGDNQQNSDVPSTANFDSGKTDDEWSPSGAQQVKGALTCSGPNSACQKINPKTTSPGTFADPDNPGFRLCPSCFLKSIGRRGTGDDAV